MVNGITSAFGSSLLEGTVKQMREAILSYIETGKPVNIQALPADVIDMATDIKVASLPEVAQSGKIANITVPLLVLQGRDDPYGTAAQVEVIVAAAGGRVTPALLEDCGHAPHQEFPGLVLDLMTCYINRIIG